MNMKRTWLAAALACAVMTACEKKEGGGVKLPNADQIKTAAADAKAKAGELIAGQFGPQIEQFQGQLAGMKATATETADEKLKGLVASIETQITAAKGKLSELSSANADKAQSLQGDLQGIVSEISKLYDQAKARAAELVKN